jgi:hypothetical protein
MTSMLEWLLGLEQIKLESGAPLSIRFATPPAPWIMLAGAVGAAMVIARLVRYLPVNRWWKWVFFVLRWGAVMSVLFMIGQPLLVLRRTQREPSRVEFLIDQSASMGIRDGDSKRDEAAKSDSQTRWKKACDLVDGGSAFRKNFGQQETGLWCFAEQVVRCKGDAAPKADCPNGGETDIGEAIKRVLDGGQFTNLSALVLISDGRQTATDRLRGVLEMARERSIPVHTIGVGSAVAPCDLRVDDVWADEQVYVQDLVTIRVQADAEGVAPGTEVRIELREKDGGQLLSSFARHLESESGHVEAELDYRPAQMGPRTLVVTAVPLANEKDTTNNQAELTITAHDRKIRVLYVEGQPRFEYRFLKNLLIREPSIDSSCLLLGATPDFPQEGSSPIRRFPSSMEELSRYDVVVLGDVDPRAEDWMSPAQQIMLADFVSNLGGGLAFVAGERNMPQRVQGTTLEKLLPVKIDPQFSGRYERVLDESFTPRLTPEGRQSLLFHLGASKEDSDRTMAVLPGWYYAARVLGAQPGASVLMVHPAMESESGPMPLAVLGRYGAGRTFYLGTDDLWRWRQYEAEHVYENVWLQAIRSLARGRKLGHDQVCRLDTDRRQYNLGDSAVAKLTILDETLVQGMDEVDVEIRREDEIVDRLKVRASGMRAGVLEGAFVCGVNGHLTLMARDSRLEAGSVPPKCAVEVVHIDNELRRSEADSDNLRRIAKSTGGQARWITDDLTSLARAIPDRSIERPDDIEEPLWDTRLMVLLLTGLLSAEWILRRVLSLP